MQKLIVQKLIAWVESASSDLLSGLHCSLSEALILQRDQFFVTRFLRLQLNEGL